jgi:predicted TIM-barrel fold metal-dependent hydrolase
VCILAGGYETVMNLETGYFSGYSEEAKAKIFGGNCLRFYGVR